MIAGVDENEAETSLGETMKNAMSNTKQAIENASQSVSKILNETSKTHTQVEIIHSCDKLIQALKGFIETGDDLLIDEMVSIDSACI